ncbi:MAG: hypothetical protein WCD38_04095 [Candidatus Tumulicola sp.]
MKRLVLAVVAGCAIAVSSGFAAQAASPNMSGTWNVEQTGLNGNTTATVKLTQSGMGLVGTSSNGTGFTGEFVNDTQINGKWHGPTGAGWLTVYASPNGHSFNGTWGYNGRPANGSFVGNKFLPPSPISAAGTWNVKGAGGEGGFAGTMKCTQSGPTVVCHVGPYIINGKFRTKDKVRANWTGPTGKGWYSFWFNGDNNSYNGIWGNGADTTKPAGRVVGQRSLNA